MRRTLRFDEELKDHVLEQVLDQPGWKAFYLRMPDRGRMMSTCFIFSPEGIILTGDLTPARHGRGATSCYGYGLGWFAGRLSDSYLCEKFLEKGWHADLAAEDLRDMAAEIRRGRCDDEFGRNELRKAAEERRELGEEILLYRRDRREARGMPPGPDREQALEEGRPFIAHVQERLKPLREKVVRLREDLAARLEDLAQECEYGNYVDGTFYEEWRKIEPHVETPPGWGYDPVERGWLVALQKRFSELYALREPAPVGPDPVP